MSSQLYALRLRQCRTANTIAIAGHVDMWHHVAIADTMEAYNSGKLKQMLAEVGYQV